LGGFIDSMTRYPVMTLRTLGDETGHAMRGVSRRLASESPERHTGSNRIEPTQLAGGRSYFRGVCVRSLKWLPLSPDGVR
jgi:hypothetical protein